MGSKNINQFSSFKIVLLYALVSGIYIYASDYFLALLISDVTLLSKLQTEKGIIFILVTTAFLYLLLKKTLTKPQTITSTLLRY